jgi:hypothetical protein
MENVDHILKKDGKDIILIGKKEKIREDEYGDPIFSPSTQNIKGFIKYRRGFNETITVAGKVKSIDMEAMVAESLGIKDSNNYKLEVDNIKYEVIIANSVGDGFLHLICERWGS